MLASLDKIILNLILTQKSEVFLISLDDTFLIDLNLTLRNGYQFIIQWAKAKVFDLHALFADVVSKYLFLVGIGHSLFMLHLFKNLWWVRQLLISSIYFAVYWTKLIIKIDFRWLNLLTDILLWNRTFSLVLLDYRIEHLFGLIAGDHIAVIKF